jgi:hypothetical protein
LAHGDLHERLQHLMLPLLRHPLPYRRIGLAHGVIPANEPAPVAPWDRSSAVLSSRLNYQRHHEWDIEQSFLAAKAWLATRPVFHRTDAAIRGHVFCTFLALVLRRELLDRLAVRGGAVPEWQCIIDDLFDLSAVEVDQDGRRALLRTAPRPSIDPICRALGIILPPVFQEVPTDKASISAD